LIFMISGAECQDLVFLADGVGEFFDNYTQVDTRAKYTIR